VFAKYSSQGSLSKQRIGSGEKKLIWMAGIVTIGIFLREDEDEQRWLCIS
jgi:hypothetical protein